jgi:hypothetical protein
MTLLSPLALLFAMTALVPLMLHLYQRRRRIVVVFSTNRFFTKSVVRSQRRLRLRRLLLLMLRIAACLLFAMALARPILGLTGLVGAGTGNRDLVIVLDDSLSMQAAEMDPGASAAQEPGLSESGAAASRPADVLPARQSPSRLDHARTTAREVLNTLTSGDRAAVLTTTGRGLGGSNRDPMALSSDIARLVKQVQQFKPAPAAGDAPAALIQAAQLLRGSSQRARSLLILTDLQAGDWGRSDWPQPETGVRTILARLDPPTHENLLVEQVFLSQGTVVTGQPNLLRVRLVNAGNRPARAPLAVDIDGAPVARRTVELPGSGPQIERVPVVFDTPGEHTLKVSIDAPDALPADNTYYATVQVNPRLPVLLVNGEVDNAREKSAAFYLQAALGSVSNDPATDSIPVQVMAPAEMAGVDLGKYRVVILSNVPDLPIAQIAPLEQFVQAGGGLAILPGDRCDPKFYNEVLGSSMRPRGGLLPADLRSRLGAPGGVEAMHIIEADADHPLLARFKGPLRGALATIRIYQAYGLSPRDGWTLASMDHQMPLIVEREYGQGRVILFATLPKPSWTDWPVRRAFIPLASALVNYLAGGSSAILEQPVCRDLPLRGVIRSSEQPPQVRRPDNSLVQARIRPAGGQAAAYLPAALAEQVGLYRVQAGANQAEILAVNAPRRESGTQTLDPEEALKRAGRWRPTIVDLTTRGPTGGKATASSLAVALTTAAGSTPIWNSLLWVVLAIVALEPLIANRRTAGVRSEG